MPDTAQMIAHSKQVPDHVRDALQGPVIFRIAVGISAALQSAHQVLSLGLAQIAGSPGYPSPHGSFGLTLRATPAAYTLGRRTYLLGNGRGSLPISQQLQRALTPARQLFGCAEWS